MAQMAKKQDRKAARAKHRSELLEGYQARVRETIAMLRRQEQAPDVFRNALRELRHKFTRTIKTLSVRPQP